ncbi:MAG: hypothetical protein FJ206_11795 [Gemmatimonadetes bacterium]|nr:hypothetical protein [Gemmatimonadota bacterium]
MSDHDRYTVPRWGLAGERSKAIDVLSAPGEIPGTTVANRLRPPSSERETAIPPAVKASAG